MTIPRSHSQEMADQGEKARLAGLFLTPPPSSGAHHRCLQETPFPVLRIRENKSHPQPKSLPLLLTRAWCPCEQQSARPEGSLFTVTGLGTQASPAPLPPTAQRLQQAAFPAGLLRPGGSSCLLHRPTSHPRLPWGCRGDPPRRAGVATLLGACPTPRTPFPSQLCILLQ